MLGKVGIVMGSDSDYPVVSAVEKTLKEFGVDFETRIISAHRTPLLAEEFATKAEEKGIEVIIAAAGKAAHLAGVIASMTVLPVIGIPMKTSDLGGMDSLLSVVQMPSGVPVATVAIGGSQNAAILAVQILSIKYPELKDVLKKHKKKMAEVVENKDRELQGRGATSN